MMSIDNYWQILEGQLDSAADLLPQGATRQLLDDVESALSITLPSDFRQFYSHHDGTGEFFVSPWRIVGGAQTVLPLATALNLWKSMCDLGTDFEADDEVGEQDGPIKHNYWNGL